MLKITARIASRILEQYVNYVLITIIHYKQLNFKACSLQTLMRIIPQCIQMSIYHPQVIKVIARYVFC